MAPECGRCGYSYRREPGFYLGSIYINYGVTAICTILLYALMVMGLGASHERALTVSVVVAVVLPVLFFRWARALLLALDNSVNANQSHGTAMTADAGAGTDAGLNLQQLTDLKADDGNAGCVMGVALALILLFGLLMAGVTLSFVMSQPALDSTGWESERSPEPKRGIFTRPMPHFPTGVQEQPLAYTLSRVHNLMAVLPKVAHRGAL